MIDSEAPDFADALPSEGGDRGGADDERQSEEGESEVSSALPMTMTEELVSNAVSKQKSATALQKYFGRLGAGKSAILDRTASGLRSKATIFEDQLLEDSYDPKVPCVLQPTGRLRFYWDALFFVCFMYDVWYAPIEVAFDIDVTTKPSGFRILELVSLVVFVLDIVVNFNTGFVSKDGDVVMKRRRIARNYLRSWFWLDVPLTCLDVAVLVFLPADDKVTSVRVVRTLKMYRQIKAVKLIRSARMLKSSSVSSKVMGLSNHSLDRAFCLKLLQAHFALSFLVHVNALLWSVSNVDWQQDHGQLDTIVAMSRYAESMRYVYNAMTFGSDVPVSSFAQELLSVVINIQRTTWWTFAVVALLWRVTLMSSAFAKETVAKDLALAYLRHRRVSLGMQVKVFQSLTEARLLRRQKEEFERCAMTAFPLQLRQSVLGELWSQKLISLDLIFHLATWRPAFVKELSLCVREEIFPSRVVVFSIGDMSDAAYLVLQGSLSVTADGEGSSLPDLHCGMWLGEKALVNHELRRNETVVCKSVCQLMKTPEEEFRRLLLKFKLKDKFEKLLGEHLWLGLCGRCGMLGDHYPMACPSNYTPAQKLEQEALASNIMGVNASFVKSAPFAGARLFSRLTGFTMKAAPSFDQCASMSRTSSIANSDLAQFLEAHDIGHLFAPMLKHGIHSLNDLNISSIGALRADPGVDLTEAEEQILSESAVVAFRKKMRRATSKLLSRTDQEHHYMFLSHFKAEAGSAAALMQDMATRLLQNDANSGAHNMDVPVFLDSENLRDLNELRSHVVRSHNLVLLLTDNVLKRPWCLLEIIVAVTTGTYILPVRIDQPGSKFEYPNEEYYERLRNGEELDSACLEFLRKEGVELHELEMALRKVFNHIAVPFSPHKSMNIRQAELLDLLKECRRRPRGSFQVKFKQPSRSTLHSSSANDLPTKKGPEECEMQICRTTLLPESTL